jgi:NAD(P)-dependent dehydrogenase (short-subunit alcohol dehydrogenase family)
MDLGISGNKAAVAASSSKTTGDPYHFGQAVAFLCSEQARFITGTGLLVDGGQSSGLLA